MACEKKPVILKWNFHPAGRDPSEASFESVLDTTCERLWERRIQYSLRRIREMDVELENLEKSLDKFTDEFTEEFTEQPGQI